MTGYVRTSKSKKRPPISRTGLHILQRLATWQRDADCYPLPADIVAAGGPRDWISLQGLLGRGLVNLTESGLLRLTGEGWRYLRIHGSS
jgi:hypothetical protein